MNKKTDKRHITAILTIVSTTILLGGIAVALPYSEAQLENKSETSSGKTSEKTSEWKWSSPEPPRSLEDVVPDSTTHLNEYGPSGPPRGTTIGERYMMKTAGHADRTNDSE